MAPTGFAPVVGNPFTLPWDGVIYCRVLEAIPDERLVYSWTGGHAGNEGYGAPLDTLVAWSLRPVAVGTRVRLVHSGFVLPRNETAFTGMGKGWKTIVSRLEAVAAEQTLIIHRRVVPTEAAEGRRSGGGSLWGRCR